MPQITDPLNEIINIEHCYSLFFYKHLLSSSTTPTEPFLPSKGAVICSTHLAHPGLGANVSDKVWLLNLKKAERWFPILTYHQLPKTHPFYHHYCYIHAPLQTIIPPDTSIKGDIFDQLKSHCRCVFLYCRPDWHWKA